MQSVWLWIRLLSLWQLAPPPFAGTAAPARESHSISAFFRQCYQCLANWQAVFIARYLQAYDHWVAFGLLAQIGIRLLISGMGLSLAMLDVEILQPILIIGIVTMILSINGLQVGDRLGLRFEKIMRVAGGVILISIGIRILITHIL